MGERNRFAFDRDYYNRIANEINGSVAKRRAASFDDEKDLEEYLTATYAPEYKNYVFENKREIRETSRTREANAAREISKHKETGKTRQYRNNASPVRENRENVMTSERVETTPEIRTKYKIRLNPIKTAFVSFLVFAAVQCALILLSIMSDVISVEKEIATAKISLEDVNSYNESLLGQLDISYDRNYIYNVAVGKLGMVYPKDNAVVYYKSVDTSHVIQYRDIS
ncbi:MAG: hypothetical protein K6F44_00810 [Lachnospiraceae bacterium]|nr:hypothetical protein [Lachnospiraceae bacterium]